MRRPRRRPALAATVTVMVTLVTACGGGAEPRRPGAAEPATAAAPRATPAGVVRAIGDTPEGIVYDASSRTVAVAVREPDRLLMLDPTSLSVRRTVPLPGDVRHLQVGRDGVVLVPAESANQIVEVPAGGGSVSVQNVRRQPHDAAEAGNGDIVVGNEFGKSISVIRSGKVVGTIADLKQPGGVVTLPDEPNSIAVVDVGAFTLSTYDLTTLTRTARVSAGKGPTHGEPLPGGRIIVADTRGDRMLVYSASPLKQIGSLALPGTPYGMAVDRSTGTVWVTLTARNQLVGLDTSQPDPRVIARYPTVQQPNTVAVAPGSKQLWITGTARGELQLITR